MIHKHILTINILLSAILLCGCSKTEPFAAEDISSVNDGIILNIARSSLDNLVEDGYQHVKTVHLYIFDGNGEDALCVASEAVDWSNLAAPDEGINESRERSYKIQYRGFSLNHDYTLLAVGLDVNAGTIYNLPNSIRKGVTTLGNAFVTLRSGGSLTDITSTELYGGMSSFRYENPYITQRVDLYRRVAGIKVNCSGIPEQVNGRDVSSVQLRLFKTPTMKVYLSKGIADHDFAELPLNYKDTDDSCIVLSGTPAEDCTVALKGYLLPQHEPFTDFESMAEAGFKDAYFWLRDYTFRIELADAEGKTLQSYRVKMYSSVSGEDGQTSVAGPADPYRYPLEANHLYNISCDFSAGGEGLITVDDNWQYDVDIEID